MQAPTLRSGSPTETAPPQTRLLLVLLAMHFLVDTAQGVVPAYVPFLRDGLNLSYTMAGGLITFATLSSSIFQPLLGLWCDRRRQPWMLPVGVLVAGLGIAATGMIHSYLGIGVGLAVMSAGVALFHPEAARTAYNLSGSRRATGMSWFLVGGNLGFAMGPMVTGFLVAAFGLGGTRYLILPSAVGALVVLVLLRQIQNAENAALADDAHRGGVTGANNWPGQVLVLLVILLRSATQYGVMTFVPIYLVDFLNGSPLQVSTLLTLFLVFGTMTTLVVGPLADRVGRKPLLLLAMVVLGPTVALIPFAPGWALYPIMAVAGMCIMGTWTVTLVLGQEFLPRSRTLASALNLSIGALGGVFATPLGYMADTMGLTNALLLIIALPVLGALVTWRLPDTLVPSASRAA